MSAMRLPSALVRKLLVATLLLATVGTLAGGTLATFTGQARNAGNTFTTGTLVLLDEINASTATDCYSTSVTSGLFTNGDANGACASSNFTPTTPLKPGATVTMQVMVKNVGSVAAGTLGLYTQACTAASVAAESYHGAGDPCSTLLMYVQEWTSATYATPSSCSYGTTASPTTCNFQAGSPTLATFTSAHGSAATALTPSGGLGAGAARYFTIALQLPQSADNTLQGRQANFDLSWYVSQ